MIKVFLKNNVFETKSQSTRYDATSCKNGDFTDTSSSVTCKVSSFQLPKLRDLVLDTVGPKLVWTWAQSWQRNIPFFKQAYLGSARENHLCSIQ